MSHLHPNHRWLLILALLLPLFGTAAPLRAQDDDEDEFEEVDPIEAARRLLAEDQASREDDSPAAFFDAAVQTIIEAEPSTAVELTRAVTRLLDFERPKLAQNFFQELLALELDELQMADLGAAVGSEPLRRIANSRDLGPEAAEFGLAVLRAWRIRLIEPERLAQLAERTLNDDPQVRGLAIVELRQVGLEGVAPLVRILADADRADVHARAREALVLFGEPAAQPLFAVLTTLNPVLKQNVTRVLAQLQVAHTGRYLYADAWADPDAEVRRTAQRALQMVEDRIAPTHEARRVLASTSRAFMSGERRVAVDVDGTSVTWQWNDRTGALIETREMPVIAAARRSARLAEEWVRLEPENETARRWLLVCRLQVMKLASGLNARFPSDVAAAIPPTETASTPVQINAALEAALEGQATAAAIAAAEMIEQLARAGEVSDQLLVRGDGSPAPLARALRHGESRLQLAAAAAIVALRPRDGFNGAGSLVPVLRQLVRQGAPRRAVVADPRAYRADQIAALLAEQGYEITLFDDGYKLYRDVTVKGQTELILLAYTMERPDIRRTIELLRNDARTAQLPIGLVATPEDILAAEALAENYGLVTAFLRPRDTAAMQSRVDRVLGSTGIGYRPPEVRKQQALEAIGLLDELTLRPSPFDLRGFEDDLEPSLYDLGLVTAATKVLGQINRHRAQRILVDFASANALPVASRRAAVAAFSDSLARHGILLNYDEIQEQAVRYDQSEGLEAETEEVLWSILDALQSVKKQPALKPDAAER
ncbi:MAG: hypothetical protein DWQ31_04795 [Planctomycetota bacterium]|nr:MAG: hypothetical protein DWQ31_04795 [Planctomycetota bacterium]REJ87856.1 MAG: hypothetical protein DWQ35_20680 [Planctomycetota bacterium]REK26432.1 MAG: hypothetical protein DWQ42_08890 [Planctomycetota bacterium]REK43277.1 MAG: hypothetical protein DWQ46_12000 [Planctomycetota bacterium]